MKKFKWDDRYKLGIPLIDEQHQKLIGIMGELGDAIEHHLSSNAFQDKPAEKTDIQHILDQLSDYANLHFETEEKLFHQYHYEKTKEHGAQHDVFRKKTIAFKKKLAKINGDLALEILEFIEDWFINHVIGFDREYVPCFHDHGL